MKNTTLLLAAILLISHPIFSQKIVTTYQVPGAAEFCKIDPKGYSVLPSGRYVTPAGKAIPITRAPYGLAISPDGQTALVLHNDVVTKIDLRHPDRPVRMPSYDKAIPPVLEGSSCMGIAYLPDGKTAWLSGGDKGTVVLLDVENNRNLLTISLNGKFSGKNFEDSYVTDLVLDKKRNHLLALDRGNNRLIKLDLTPQPAKGGAVIASIPVGRIPFGIAISPDGKTAFVANVGIFDYPLVPGLTPENIGKMGLEVPAYGYPSKEAEEGTTYSDGRKIPGLGSPLDERAMSIWTVDLDKNTVTGKFKTGLQIGDEFENEEEEEEGEIVGGAHPNSVAVGSRFAYISNSQNDLISVFDLKKQKVVKDIPLKFHKTLDHYRGIMPFGVALSPDEKTLYVACLSLNAVAVIDTKKRKVKGYIPTGWMPSRVKVSPDGKQIFVTSARGYGAGPNGGKGFIDPPQGAYIGDIQLGIFQIIDVPDAATLANYTQQVLKNTFREVPVVDDGKNPLPVLPGLRESPIKHIVYVTKENRTYDEVFGQLPQAKGDPTIARFGNDVDVPANKDGSPAVAKADIMPNHLKIAQQWAASDNFYCDSDASIHGHKWMVGTIPNEYVEVNSQTSADHKPFSSAPGRRFPRTTGAQDPEDYNERGGIWENLARDGVTYYNFGEANEYTEPSEEKFDTLFGARHSVVYPMPKVLFDRTSFTYPGYNTNVPDQFRMDKFEEEFMAKWGSGKDSMPDVLTIILPNDHGSGPRPTEGYPYLESYMSDNDLALGRLLHFLSRTPYWKNMLVVVTEDDPQGGIDHVDAHRSVLLMAGPYVKRGYVSHTHANFGSLLRLIYTLTDAGFVNHYDLTASLLTDFFTDKPDYTPYTLEPVDARIFDPQKAMDIYHKTFNWEKIKQGPKLDDEGEQRKWFYEQQGKN
ncbi:MAG: phosphoesterase [Saprospiraceae bacterium]|nr:phosphoesterase [Saprospiraceae bacterium]